MGSQNPFAPGARYVPPQDTPQIYSARSLVRFLSQAVQPPSQVYVEQTDVLRITAASSQANEVITVNYRLLKPDGDVVLGQSTLAVPANRSIAIHDEPMAEGFLLSVSCKAAVATTRGQTFVRVFLTDPDLGGGQPSYILMADYVTTAMAPSHPNGRVLAPSEGPGFMSTLTAAPAAGVDFTFTVPTNARWRIAGAMFELITSAVVANRIVTLRMLSGAAVLYQLAVKIAVPASNAAFMNVTQGSWDSLTSGTAIWETIPVPGAMLLLAGGTISTVTTNIQVADQWFSPALQVEEWLDNV